MKNNLVSVKIIIDEFRKELSLLYPQEEIMQFLYLLFEEKMGWSRADVHINFPLILNKEDTIWFRDALDQLLKHRPIQYVIGSCQFLDLRIRVRTGVLIPRPETEELVEMLVHDYFHRRYEDLSLLDIGTGSGAVAGSAIEARAFVKLRSCEPKLRASIFRRSRPLPDCC